MGFQKKHGKARRDLWYFRAKESGYRARAAYKLIQLNRKYGFLEGSRVLLDLCAAPGSWCQVASKTMPDNSLIVGVDLDKIKPIPRVITFQSDITSGECRATLRSHLRHLKADTVLHDGAPNVGAAWIQDAFGQAELVLQSLRLATEFLAYGGTFVTKLFRSSDSNNLLYVLKQLFESVESTKPPASRNVSAEIFVVARGFKAPKRIDPKLLEPRTVFAELAITPNNEAKVFNPERKKRKRDGYEDGDFLQFKEATASAFIQTSDPIAMLASLNKLSFEQKEDNGDIAQAAINKMEQTTNEIRECASDLKVLGRKEFRLLLRWRLKVRDIFGFSSKSKELAVEEDVTEIEPMDEELRIQEELHQLNDKETQRRKRERRRENEKKQREIVRLQMHMGTPTEIGLEQNDDIFRLKSIDSVGFAERFAKGRMIIPAVPQPKQDAADPEDSGSDEEEDNLDRQLDSMYEQFQERKSAADAKYRAKKMRTEQDDGDWEGFSEAEEETAEELELAEESDSSTEDEEETKESLKQFKSTSSASSFFAQDIFEAIDGLDQADISERSTDELGLTDGTTADDDTADDLSEEDKNLNTMPYTAKTVARSSRDEAFRSSEDAGFEVVEQERANDERSIEIITYEAMNLARDIGSGEKKAHDLIDDSFNKLTFRDVDGLPDWFLDDEKRHSKPNKPVSAAAVKALKEKSRLLNARPIKKVREAKDRKRHRAVQRLEKLKKKSALLIEDEGMSERDKAQSISKLMSKAAKKRPKQQVKLVVAKGVNRGISGRPKGVKGKYKLVDSRLKKDLRAQKRLAKKRR